MRMEAAELGRDRTELDGCRRYLPIMMVFDTRARILKWEPTDDWEPAARAQQKENQSQIREAILHQYGVLHSDYKIANFVDLDAQPFSVVTSHNEILRQSRNAFVSGSYFPALVGAATLGERIFNELIITLRDEPIYASDPMTKKVAGKGNIDDWSRAIRVLTSWKLLTEDAKSAYKKLAGIRVKAVHYLSPDLSHSAREDALHAIFLVQKIIEELFSPIGGPPRFISGTQGASFISTEFEATPFFQYFFKPACVLVSPSHELRPGLEPKSFIAYDDVDYGMTEVGVALSDQEFAHRRNNMPN